MTSPSSSSSPPPPPQTPPQTPSSKRKVSHLRIRQLLPSGWGSDVEDNEIVIGTRSTPTSPKSERRRQRPPPASAFAELSRSVNSLLNIHREQVDGDRRGDGLLPRLIVTDEDGVQTSSGDSSAASSRSASPNKAYHTRKYSDCTEEMRGRSNSTSSLVQGEKRRKSQPQSGGGSSSSTSNLLTAVLNRTLRKKYFHHLFFFFFFHFYLGSCTQYT